jgi:hypothetical protein
MKIFLITIFVTLYAGFCEIHAQQELWKDSDQPILIRPTNHDPNFTDFPARSFYESYNNWQQIIDTTWGPGLPLIQKQNIFNVYANTLRDNFDGFLSLGMNLMDFDTMCINYYGQITDNTSRGAYSAILSRLSHRLRDIHTNAVDTIMWATPLNPGVPILVLSGFVTVEHFGAILTTLPDSTLLVLRVVPNHPLGLQPGDIILGYEGVPWKNLVEQLLQAGLPLILGCSIGAESANLDYHMLGAGMNWHLFNTIDIVQFSTGDTLHLPVAPLINLNIPPMLNNEQLDIPGLLFPDYFNGQIVSYGIMPGTNIGYIYLFEEWPQDVADQQFFEAVDALKNTEGLIIDMRLNFGGYALFDEAFDILFNEFHLTTDFAVRTGPSTLTLRPVGNRELFRIDANKSSLYDHPIAILLGPTCVSMGDITAHRFRYHPTVRFFGKPPGASLGDNTFIDSYGSWFLRYSFADQYHFNTPGQYLNRLEFPIDYPVWHTPQDVANGIDAVVKEAQDWIGNLVYVHDLTIDKKYYSPLTDSLHLETLVENPNSHSISAMAYVYNPDSSFTDTVFLSKTMRSEESEIWEADYPAPSLEDHFKLSTIAYDSTDDQEFMIRNVDWFTTIGPLILNSYELQNVIPLTAGYRATLTISVRNADTTRTAEQIQVEIVTEDSTGMAMINAFQDFGDIPAGQIVSSPSKIYFITNTKPLIDTVLFKVNIYSHGVLYWQDSTANIIVGVENIASNLPKEYVLYANYPNPFNPTTMIKFDLPKTSDVTLKVYNILGEEVTTILSASLLSGSYSYEFDASDLASGVYLYRLQTGDFVETKKMILMR